MSISKSITAKVKNTTFTQGNLIIENSGLELELIQNLPFVKMWSVKNNKEITHITNTMTFVGDMSKVTYCFNW